MEKSNKIISLQEIPVYVVMGIDEHEHDQLLQLFYRFDDAKEYCAWVQRSDSLFYDLWIESHIIS